MNHSIAKGSGVTIAVLDGVFAPSAPSLVGANVTPPRPNACVGADGSTAVTATTPRANHATQMVAMIAGQGGANVPLGVAPSAKVLVYNVGIGTDTDTVLACKDGRTADQVTGAAITDAVAQGARIISMSFSGQGSQPATETAIQFGERKGVVFVASTEDAANVTGSRLREPAAFNGVVVVNGIDQNGAIVPNSATGDPDGPLVVASAPGKGLTLGGYQPGQGWNATTYIGGSSPATAFVAGALAVTASKWPNATGNQLIQSLARNTGGEEHNLEARALDGYGYGVVSVTSMVAHDPSKYPDVNPTLRDNASPRTADIQGSNTTTRDPDGQITSSSTPVANKKSLWPIIAGAIVILGVVAGIINLVLMKRRRKFSGTDDNHKKQADVL